MTKLYEFSQPAEETPVEQRWIDASETVSEVKTEKFTLADKEAQLASAKQEVLNAQQRVKDLEAELLAIKTALEIPIK